MDLLLGRTATLGLMLSVFLSVAVVAYRNDLSTNRHGCVWSTMEKEAAIPTPSIASSSPPGPYISGLLINPPHQQHGLPGGGGGGGGLLNCNLRTLNVDFWNYTFNRDQIEQTRVVRIKCSDKLFFESVLTPNQTLFQLRNLKEVQIESCKIRKIPKRVWASLTELKSLTIRTQNTEWRASSAGLEVEQGSFEGQGQLEYLSLAENNLWSLGESKNALCPLRNLVHLNVSYNRLSDIEELISASPVVSRSESGENLCALNVQNVDVSHNHIRRVGHNAFSNFPRMSELRLQNNLISELEDTAFTGLGQIKLLNLSSNRIVALPPTIFQSNGNIREIFLQNNTISAISSRVFSGLENLLSLDLSRNTLTSQWIKEDIFQGLSRLVILKLSSNQLSYVDGSIFKDLISLQSLSLERNKIDTIHPTAFNSLRNLHFLDLSFNRLSHIDSRVFSNLVVLSQLTLDHNKIRSLEDNALKNCSSISDLILANNRLLNVPVAIKSLSYLKTLDIGENLITHVNNASFTGMVQLIGLRMVDNRIESLPSGFCSSMKKLRVLNLSQNKIREISSSAFISCPELRVLRLDTNSLQELPPTLAPQLPSLLWLNVSENQIRSADYRLLPPSTEWLDLSYNVIETLGPISRNVTHDQRSSSLRVMDISYNRLKSLDQSGIPASLETLRINHNSQFKTVEPNTFLASTQLRRVELIGNQIEILPLEALQLPQIPSGRMLPDFYLANNPFTQNCQMEWLTRTHQLTVLRTHPHIVDLDAILLRPTFPRPNQAVSLMDTRAQDFLCPYKSHCFALCHCCEFEFCDCEMSCPDNCTCYHDNSWSSNIVVCSNLQYENVPEKIPMDSSELYLDGNNISQLGSHIFIGKKNLLSLYLNGSNVESIKNKTFNGLKALQTLNLQDNFLSELNGYEFADLENIREIYLQNNEIVTIHKDTFANLKFLQVLRIDGNLIVDFNVWELSANGYLNSVMLANNPWNCDCDFLIPFRNWVASKTTIVADFSLATCQIYYAEDEDHQHDGVMSKFSPSTNHQLQPTISSMCNFASNADITFNYEQNGNNELLEINNHISSMGGAAEKVAGPVGPLPPPSENHSNFSRLDTNSADNTFWALLLCLTAFLIVILVILAIFRQEIYYWARNGLLNGGESSGGFLANLLNCCCCCPEKYSGTHHPGGAGGKNLCPSTMLDDQEKLFDAYFLYAKRDEDMLIQKIVPELEDPTTASTTPGHKFRLCLHYRDLCLSPESPWNREMILSACDASKRVVLVLSNTFLQSEWSSSIHFRTSIQSAIALHPKKLIFILLPDFNQNMSSISSELSNYSSTNTIKNSCVSWSDKNFWTKFKRLLPKPTSPIPHCLLGGENGTNLQNEIYNNSSCDPSQLPYNLVMNPNLAQLHHLQQLQQQQQTLRSNHYHSNILPYQIPVPNGMMSRTNSLLPPVPKHQIVLPANSNNNGLHQHNHNAIISSSTTNNSLIHPIPSQLTPQAFGYSNETFHLQQNNHHQNFVNHHHPNNNHNQPIHFSSPQQNPHHQHHPLHHQQMHPVIIPPHSHHHHPQHLHTASQVSNNFSTSLLYPHHHQQTSSTTRGDDQPNYSSSAVSSCAEFDHVYSTLDSPIQSPGLLTSDRVDYSPNGGGGGPTNNTVDSRNSSKHTVQHSTSSGVSSGSDMTCGGESSSAVSPSSPIKNGILNKLNAHMNSNNNPGGSSNTNQNGKMYFV